MEHDRNWALICKHVSEGERQVRLIMHERDGDWQIVCGEYDHGDDDCIVVCSACAAEQYPELLQHQSLQPGFMAELTGGEWTTAAFDI